MWLIPMMLLAVTVGMVLMLLGWESLQSPTAGWLGTIGGLLCLVSGGSILLQTVTVLLNI